MLVLSGNDPAVTPAHGMSEARETEFEVSVLKRAVPRLARYREMSAEAKVVGPLLFHFTQQEAAEFTK